MIRLVLRPVLSQEVVSVSTGPTDLVALSLLPHFLVDFLMAPMIFCIVRVYVLTLFVPFG